MPPTRWAFSGSRTFGLQAPVATALGRLVAIVPDLEVSVGDAKGLDALVRRLCSDHRIPFRVHHADWEGLGKRAGHERNTRVLQGAVGLLAFYGDAGATPGTTNAILQATAMGLEVHIFSVVQGGRWVR